MDSFRPAAAEFIKEREQFKPYTYDDATGKKVGPKDVVQGKVTIGYGFTKGVKAGDTMTQQQANMRLAAEIEPFAKAVEEHVKVAINDQQKAALTSLAYNIGLGGKDKSGNVVPGFTTSTLLRNLNEGDISGAAQQFMAWNKDNGRTVEGLSKRRRLEQALFLGIALTEDQWLDMKRKGIPIYSQVKDSDPARTLAMLKDLYIRVLAAKDPVPQHVIDAWMRGETVPGWSDVPSRQIIGG